MSWGQWGEYGVINGVIGGDFSVCRFENQRYNFTTRSKAMRDFSETIKDMQLMISHYKGHNTTGLWEKTTFRPQELICTLSQKNGMEDSNPSDNWIFAEACI